MFPICIIFFFFNDTATTEIYTLSLHDALPIYKYKKYKYDVRRKLLEEKVIGTPRVKKGVENLKGFSASGDELSGLSPSVTKKLQTIEDSPGNWILQRRLLNRIKSKLGPVDNVLWNKVMRSKGKEGLLDLTDAYWNKGAGKSVPSISKISKEVSKTKMVESLIKRSEERRVGKECRSRWSPYH